MANEFKIKNGLIVDQGGANITGSTLISGSLTVTEGITGSLFGTSSYAITASYALNGGGGGNAFPYTGSAEITGSLGVTGSITTTGNVGIGTSSPSYPFQISKNLADLTAYMQNTNAGSYGLLIRAGNTSTYALSVEKYDGTNISRFHGSGNVVIGDSVADTARLFVKGSGATTATTAFRIENSAGDSSLIVNDAGKVAIGANRPTSSVYDLNVSYVLFDYMNGGTYAIGGVNVINYTGGVFVHGIPSIWNARFDYPNVLMSGSFTVSGSSAFLGGITGSTSITGSLSLTNNITVNHSTNDARFYLRNTTTGYGASDGLLWELLDVDAYLWNYENGPFYFGTNATARMTILGNGNIGIGTTSPSTLLHIKSANNTNATYNTVWYNSDNTWLAGMRDDGLLALFAFKRIYMNNVHVGEYGTNNTVLGFYAGGTAGYNGGDQNTTVGHYALFAPGASAIQNTAIGYYAGHAITTGQGNVFVGRWAGVDNTTGAENMYLGNNAGQKNSVGSENVAIGTSALNAAQSSSYNVAIGNQAAALLTTGSYNTYVGRSAGANARNTNYNTTLGFGSLFGNHSGSENIAIGIYAGAYLTDGSTLNSQPTQSIYIGSYTSASSATEQNAIVIGHGASGLGSNTVVLGNDSVTLTALKGNVAVGKTTANAKLDISGSTIISGSFTVTGSSTFFGDVIPGGPYVSNTSSYSLGSPTAAWKDLYVSNGSVYFVTGSTSASIQLVDNQITFAGAPVALPTGSITPTASYAITASYALAVAGGGPGPSSTAGGDPTQIQYNDDGAFGGVPTLVYDGTTLSATGSFTGSFTGNITNINVGEVNINFGAAPGTNVATTTVNNTLVTKNSFINIYIMSTSSVDHNADDHRLFALYSMVTPSNIIDNTSFDVVCTTDLRVNGIFTAKYIINNF